MGDQMYIHEARALAILIDEGDFHPSQAAIVLGHSRKQTLDGATYYPMTYIHKRAAANAARIED